MIPAERGGIYLSKSEASSGIDILDVCEIVVEVVVCTVAAGSLAIVGNGDTHCWAGYMKTKVETAGGRLTLRRRGLSSPVPGQGRQKLLRRW